ncbi:MAG: redoxin domain-containing protein [Crocinitomicaceae bacterium]|nr:redoxin domain-containing protein [Crocinitomicaceae bacterium]
MPQSLLETEVLNKECENVSFQNLLNNEASLIVMVRHFGCIGCTTQMLEIAPRLKELDSLGVKVKIIGNGQLQYLEGFIEKFNLQNQLVEIYTDPSLKIYKEAQMVRSFFNWMSPVTAWQFIKGFSKGITQRSIEGDNMQMGERCL